MLLPKKPLTIPLKEPRPCSQPCQNVVKKQSLINTLNWLEKELE